MTRSVRRDIWNLTLRCGDLRMDLHDKYITLFLDETEGSIIALAQSFAILSHGFRIVRSVIFTTTLSICGVSLKKTQCVSLPSVIYGLSNKLIFHASVTDRDFHTGGYCDSSEASGEGKRSTVSPSIPSTSTGIPMCLPWKLERRNGTMTMS